MLEYESLHPPVAENVVFEDAELPAVATLLEVFEVLVIFDVFVRVLGVLLLLQLQERSVALLRLNFLYHVESPVSVDLLQQTDQLVFLLFHVLGELLLREVALQLRMRGEELIVRGSICVVIVAVIQLLNLRFRVLALLKLHVHQRRQLVH